MHVALWPEDVYPLGSHWDEKGTNFARFSENATAVELCLFDRDDQETRIALKEVSFLLLFKVHYEPIEFVLPETFQPAQWQVMSDTTQPRFIQESRIITGNEPISVADRSLIVPLHRN